MIDRSNQKKLGEKPASASFHPQQILSHQLTSLVLSVFQLNLGPMNCLGLYKQNIPEQTKYTLAIPQGRETPFTSQQT
jgi:hypothetical protein